MIGILVVTHGNLGKEFIESSELIIGKQSNVSSLGLFHGDGIEEFYHKVIDGINKLDEGDGVLVLADLFGGSPSNASLSYINGKENLKCITGVNMTMYIEACMLRESLNIKELEEHCYSAGKDGIKNLQH